MLVIRGSGSYRETMMVVVVAYSPVPYVRRTHTLVLVHVWSLQQTDATAGVWHVPGMNCTHI